MEIEAYVAKVRCSKANQNSRHGATDMHGKHSKENIGNLEPGQESSEEKLLFRAKENAWETEQGEGRQSKAIPSRESSEAKLRQGKGRNAKPGGRVQRITAPLKQFSAP